MCVRKRENRKMKTWLRFKKTGSEVEVLCFFVALCSLVGATIGLALGEGLDVRPVAGGGFFFIMGLYIRGKRRRQLQPTSTAQ